MATDTRNPPLRPAIRLEARQSALAGAEGLQPQPFSDTSSRMASKLPKIQDPSLSLSSSSSSANPTGSNPVRSPRIVQGQSWPEAHRVATANLEPVLVPITPYADDRGWSLMNLLSGAMSAEGQINFSTQYPGIVKAWHRHDKQTDFWTCLVGQLKAGIFRESDGARWLAVIGEHRPAALIIPPPLWHGAACVGPTPAGLLYYVTHTYDPVKPDEHRRPWDSVADFPWQPRHG